MPDRSSFETRGSVTVLPPNRPERFNSLSYEANHLFLQLLNSIEDDDAIRAVILTDTGDRMFSTACAKSLAATDGVD